MFTYERTLFEKGVRIIAGIDEAGRGPLAGPVVAAAVILPQHFSHKTLNDSKQLTEKQREEIFQEMNSAEEIFYGLGISSVEEIDRFNILRATHIAMNRAIEQLKQKPEHVLIDGLPVKTVTIAQTAIVQGDALSFSIAAASVIAKVTRDRIMCDFDSQYPQYQFAKHKGYGTRDHLEALQYYGPCPIHRKSFMPVRDAQIEMSFLNEPLQKNL